MIDQDLLCRVQYKLLDKIVTELMPTLHRIKSEYDSIVTPERREFINENWSKFHCMERELYILNLNTKFVCASKCKLVSCGCETGDQNLGSYLQVLDDDDMEKPQGVLALLCRFNPWTESRALSINQSEDKTFAWIRKAISNYPEVKTWLEGVSLAEFAAEFNKVYTKLENDVNEATTMLDNFLNS